MKNIFEYVEEVNIICRFFSKMRKKTIKINYNDESIFYLHQVLSSFLTISLSIETTLFYFCQTKYNHLKSFYSQIKMNQQEVKGPQVIKKSQSQSYYR